MANKNMAGFIAALHEGADLLERLNETYPNLADSFTQETVIEFRRTVINQDPVHNETTEPSSTRTVIDSPANNDPRDLQLIKIAQALLAIHSFDDVLDILEAEHGETLEFGQFVTLVGNKAYITALRREASEFQSNAISLPQIAQLWNDLGRPPIGDSDWTTSSVSLVIEQ